MAVTTTTIKQLPAITTVPGTSDVIVNDSQGVTNRITVDNFANAMDKDFTGTTAEWNALTTEQKAQYIGHKIYLTDDGMGSIPIDAVPTEDSSNAVSSGGTYDALKDKIDWDVVISPSKTETTTTATNTHEAGDYFELSGTIVKALANISVGDTLTEGTNIQTTNIGTELKTINSNVTSAVSTANTASSTASTASKNATRALNIERSTTAFPTGDAYSTSSSYKVGDYVIYNNTLYRCKTACSAASWSTNQSNFESTTLTKAVTNLNASLTNLTPKIYTGSHTASGSNIRSIPLTSLPADCHQVLNFHAQSNSNELVNGWNWNADQKIINYSIMVVYNGALIISSAQKTISYQIQYI